MTGGSHAHEPMDCPMCGTRMRAHPVSGITVDKCPGCRGLWLDTGELEHLLEFPETAQSVDHELAYDGPAYNERRDISCPRDTSGMLAMTDPEQRHVKYEKCSVCGGVFLDAGELADLAEVTLLERLRMILG